MKLIILLFLFSIRIPVATAQTFSEWFDQKATQLQYSAEQIAAYKGYIQWLEKGYEVAEKGLVLINSVKTGEFSLHQAFYNSLLTVGAVITKSDVVRNTLELPADIVRFIHQFNQYENLNPGERQYVEKVKQNLLDAVSEKAGELVSLITDGNVSMDDGGRIKRIIKINAMVASQRGFAIEFNRVLMSLNALRAKEKNDLNSSIILQGLK